MEITDLKGHTYPLDAVVEHEIDLQSNERIDLDIHYTENNAEFLKQNDDLKMWLITFDNKDYRIFQSNIKTQGNKYMVSVTARLYILDWLTSHRLYKKVDASLTTTEAFNLVFNDSPFTYVIVNAASAESFEGLGDGSTLLEVFQKLIDRYGYEVNIVGNTVYLEFQMGNDTNFEYRYQLNASNITKEVDASEMYTYIKGYGNYDDESDDDTPIEERAKLIPEPYVSPLAEIIGVRHAPPIKDGRMTKEKTLKEAMKKAVDDSVQVTFSADIQDMSNQGYDYQSTTIGDRIFLVDERIGLDKEIRVSKIQRTFNAEGVMTKMSVTFGGQTLSDAHSSSTNQAITDIQDLINGRKRIPFPALDIVSQSMVSKIKATTSEIEYDTNGQHFIEKNKPNNMMTMNSSGLLLSTDGGRTAETAITAEGIVANTITSGSLNTNLITIRGGNNTNSMEITNDMVNSQGTFSRKWANVKDTARLNLGIRKGHIMVSNEDTGYNLYMTEKGLSTMMNGFSDDTSGTLEFHSRRFNETSRGITMHSTYGAVAMLSEQSRTYVRSNLTANIESFSYGVYIRPFFNTRPGVNEFNFYIKDNNTAGNTDGCLLFGEVSDDKGLAGSGIRFKKGGVRGYDDMESVVYATDNQGNIGSGSFYADKLYGSLATKATNVYAMTASKGEFRVTDEKGYNNGNMKFRPVAAKSFNQVSSLKYKTNIENIDDIGLSTVNDLTVVEYNLKSDIENGDDQTKQLGFIAEYSEPIATSEKSAIDLYKLLSYNTKAIQELYEKYIEQQKQIEQLEELNNERR